MTNCGSQKSPIMEKERGRCPRCSSDVTPSVTYQNKKHREPRCSKFKCKKSSAVFFNFLTAKHNVALSLAYMRIMHYPTQKPLSVFPRES